MDMRTGKTKTILDEFGEAELAGQLKHLLVIAPAGVYATWQTDALKHMSADLKRRVQIMIWESGPSAKVKKQLDTFIQGSGPKILLVNIEALSTVKAAQQLVGKFLQRASTMMVIDESTVIKNEKAKRTRFCLAAAQFAKRRRILSGLPTPQSPLDIYTQFAFLNPRILGHASFRSFQEEYAVMKRVPFGPGRKMISIVGGYKNLEKLKAILAPHVFRVKLEECYDLPPKLYMRRDIELTAEQARHYNNIKQSATTILANAERVTATIVLTQLLRLHQILAGHTKSDQGTIVDIPENKTAELLSILEEHRGKAVIWVAYDADIRRLTQELTKIYGPGSVARFWGGNADTRENEERQFLTDPKCRFILATAASGGRGRTWPVADLVIYYSNTFSLEHRLQSEERAQGIGKTTNVVYVDLVCRHTVEEKILEALRNKKELSDAVTGDAWREWFK